MDGSEGLEDVYKSYVTVRNRMASRLKECMEGLGSLPPGPVQVELLKILQQASADLHPMQGSVLCLAAQTLDVNDMATIEEELAGESWGSDPINAATVRLQKLEKEGAKYREAYSQYRYKYHEMKLEANTKQSAVCEKDAQIAALQERCNWIEEELSKARRAVASNPLAFASQASAIQQNDTQGEVDGNGKELNEQLMLSLKIQYEDEMERANQAIATKTAAENDLADKYGSSLEDCDDARVKMLQLQANDKFQQQENEILLLRQRLDRANENVERLQAQASLQRKTPSNMQHDPLGQVEALLIASREHSDTIRHLSDYLLYDGKIVPRLRRNCLVFDKKVRLSAVSRMPLQTFMDIVAKGIVLNPKDGGGRPVISKQRRRNFQAGIVILGALGLGGGFYDFDGVPKLGNGRARKDIQDTIAALLKALEGTIVHSVFDTLDDFKVYVEGKALFADKLVNSIEYLRRCAKNTWVESPQELSAKDRKECLHESQVNILVEIGFIAGPEATEEADDSGSDATDGSFA